MSFWEVWLKTDSIAVFAAFFNIGWHVFARQQTPAQHNPKEGAQGACMNSHAVGPPRGAPGSYSQDTVRRHHPHLDRRPQLLEDCSSCNHLTCKQAVALLE